MTGADTDEAAGKGARGIAAAGVVDVALLGGPYRGADGGKEVAAGLLTVDEPAPGTVVGTADGILLWVEGASDDAGGL